MATQLQSRRGTTAQMNAFTGAEGEIAVNTSTDTLHVHDGSTAGGHALAKADGSNIATYAGSFTTLAASGATTLSSTLAVTGEITANGGIALGDSDKATFGASDDLQIYHDGVHSRIVDAGTGNLSLQGNDLRIKNSDASATYIQAANGGAVTLHHNDAVTLATTSTGIDVTGTVTADGLTVDGNARIEEIGAIAKLTLERGGTANSADSAAVDMLETNSGTEGANFGDAGTNGFRLKLDGSANDFLIQSGAATTITTRFGIDRDSGDISFYNAAGNSQALFWDASAESLGIGTSSPDTGLDVATTNYTFSGTTYDIYGLFGDTSGGIRLGADSSNDDSVIGTTGTNNLQFVTYNGSAWGSRMTLDNTGNFIVGATSAFSSSSFCVDQSGLGQFRRDGTPLLVRRDGSIGDLISFEDDGASVGSIGITTSAGGTRFAIGAVGDPGIIFAGTGVFPATQITASDNVSDLGSGAYRWKNVYRAGSTYSTSDRNMKQDIRDLTDAERNVAVAAKGLLKAFRFIDRVEEEGNSANIHFGIIAQDLAVAFTAEGLDANDYQVYKAAVETDEDGNEQTRLNVCYENLLAFIIAAI